MATQEQLDELKIRNDDEAAEAERSIKAAQTMLRSMCKNGECMNQRRNGSAWCEECAADYKLKQQ